MEIILHVGAHRCASTSFQCYMRANTAALLAQGCGFWGPHRLRGGLLHGLGRMPLDGTTRAEAARARHRVAANVRRAEGTGLRRLVISDENMLGNIRRNLRRRRLYQDAGERMARLGEGFERVTRVHLCVRPQLDWWSSALAYAVMRGALLPGREDLEEISTSPRQWRDVVMDVACALPRAEIVVTPFGAVAGRAHVGFAAATGRRGPDSGRAVWANRGPNAATLRHLIDTRGETPEIGVPRVATNWRPFNRSQAMRLQHAWIEDFAWLAAGADGFARLVETEEDGLTVPYDTTEETRNVLPPFMGGGTIQRGRHDGRPQGYLG